MRKLIVVLGLIIGLNTFGQDLSHLEKIELNYEKPTKYQIGGISVYGNNFSDKNILILMSGLSVGKTISVPGDELRMAVEKLWKQKLFSDIEIRLAGVKDEKLYLSFYVKERPRLSKFSIKGLRKSETNTIRDEISLERNQMITEDLINKTKREIDEYFFEKGFYGIQTTFVKEADTSKPNYEILRITINKGKKIKVQDIVFEGNDHIESNKLRRLIKPKQLTKKLNPFASSKYVQEVFDESKPNVVAVYNKEGYRDARMIYDSTQRIAENRVNIKMGIAEGKKYYHRKIVWVGNTKYRDGTLDTLLSIKPGDVYDQSKLDTRLFMDPSGFDITSLYMDDGYLFFNVSPVEVAVENDSIDLEIRIFEGKQATVNRVSITGNDKTSDFVALRMIRTRPGDKFSRSDIQRSLRELAQLGFFDPEGLDVNPIPNPQNGTVDIVYKVVEKPSDQIEASGGWGGVGGFVGTLGLSLNNFSSRKMFTKGGWDPIPAGDGQKLSLRAQSNGSFYQGYTFSFTEPWLGGKKPNSFSLSLFHTVQSGGSFINNTNQQRFKTTGGSVAFGQRLKWPDDYFFWRGEITYQRYTLQNWPFSGASELGFTDGFANNLSFTFTLNRNSTDHPIYPTVGSKLNFSWQVTPPYSKFNNKDYSEATAQEKFRWIELKKTKFDLQWFLGVPNKAKRKLVFAPAIRFGGITNYNDDIGYSPFEQFKVGGSGLTNFVLYGTDIISQRGYDEGMISDPYGGGQNALPVYNMFTLEMRYPITVGQSSTIYAQTFLEAGNAFANFQEYDPFNLRRAGGVGVRLFLPMFGLLGVDYAWPLDPLPFEQKGILHFFIGQQF
jgi:outer membrane protein insertion porin family